MSNKEVATPKYVIVQTYVKDVSFENPYFLDLMNKAQEGKPDIKFNLEVKINQGDKEHFEVVLHLNVDLVVDGKAYIQTEVAFAALVKIPASSEQEEILFVDIPHQIYPEVRPLISQLFLMASTLSSFKLPIVDFRSLYLRRLEERRAAEEQNN